MRESNNRSRQRRGKTEIGWETYLDQNSDRLGRLTVLDTLFNISVPIRIL